MKSRGRPSAASLLTQSVLPGSRPEPPASLGPLEAQEWREITEKMPHDWFGRQTWPLLKELCRYTVQADAVDDEMKAMSAAAIRDPEMFKHYERLGSYQIKLGEAIGHASTRLRLTPHSQMGPRTAARKTEKTAKSRKPWETNVMPSNGGDVYAWGIPDDEI